MTYLVNLVDALKLKDFKVSIIFGKGIDPENYKVKGSRFLYPMKVFFILRKIKPEVIHSQSNWFCLLASVVYKKLYGCRLIFTFHTYPVKDLPIFFKRFFQYLLYQCDYVTFVSKGLKDIIVEIWGLKFGKTEITYAGVRAREVSQNSIKEFYRKFNMRENSKVLLAQALTVHPMKAEGAKILVNVVRKLKDKYPNILLILTKEGVYSNYLRKFAEDAGISKYVVFTGTLSNPFVPLSICDIYTHISLGDGLPLALLEAMAMGKPIIATPVGGIPEAIENGKNGILVEPNVDTISKKIEYLIENKQLAEELGRKAKKRVEEKFTWKKSSQSFIKIYCDKLT